jgi:outer membrane protein
MRYYLTALIGAACAISNCPSSRASSDFKNSLELGYVGVSFNTTSGQIAGPPGTTPPGASVGLKDTGTPAIEYVRRLSGSVSLVLQGGVPPEVHFYGRGTAAALGELGGTRAWFPGVLAVYSFPRIWVLHPYAGAGVNHTFFTDTHVADNYTAAVLGSSSRGSLSSDTGGIIKAGATVAIARRWLLDFSYCHYWISTTATVTTEMPGFGPISRHVNLTVDPDIYGLTVGYLF